MAKSTVSVAVPLGSVWGNPLGFVVPDACVGGAANNAPATTGALASMPFVRRDGAAATFYFEPHAATACLASPATGCPPQLQGPACSAAKPAVMQGYAIAQLTRDQWAGATSTKPGAAVPPNGPVYPSGWCNATATGGATCLLPTSALACSNAACTLTFTKPQP